MLSKSKRHLAIPHAGWAWLCAALLAWTLPLSAQFQRGSIIGTVTDQSNSVIGNGKVTLKNLGTNEERLAATDDRGDYSFPSLLPGSYRVTAEATGFKTQVVSDIQLEVNQTARIDLKLSVGDMVQRVEATASLQLLQTDTSEVGSVITNKQIVDLPLNGRDYLQLARLIPGAIPSRAGATAGAKGVSRSVNVAGARDTSVSFLLDARAEGVRALYLLTTTAAPYFHRAGFQVVARDQVPPEIRQSREFAHACPASAIVMTLPL